MSLNLYSPREISAFLTAHGIRPSKALGQNFLTDRNMIQRIIDAAQVQPGTRVLEIGTGLGVLTEALLDAGVELTTVEKDKALHAILCERFGQRPHCTLLFEDALRLDYGALFGSGITHLVSNLPYSVGTRVVVEAATAATPPERMTLLLQKEVCERFCAREREPERGAVSVWLQQSYDAAIVREVPPACFVPRPEVTSAVCVLQRHHRTELPRAEADFFRGLVKAAFLHRRKQLSAAMRGAGAYALPAERIRALLESVGAAPDARAEALTLEQWLHLSAAWAEALRR